MIRHLSSLAKSALGAVGFYPAPQTDGTSLRTLLQKLYLIDPGVALVRLGPMGDGGYLVPDDLDGIHACFSPGVGLISGFENDCAGRGMPVYLADKSAEKPALENVLFHFTRKFIGATTNDDFLTLDGWVSASVPLSGSDLLLQIDIEGCEYETFLGASDALMRRFRVIVAEFHGLDQLYNRPFFGLASATFEKILQTHVCVHIHPNNCIAPVTYRDVVIPPIMEFTFLRRDRIQASSYRQAFPHPLDPDNTSNPHVVLPRCWYNS
jgi:Methyltransferase FkbM domain